MKKIGIIGGIGPESTLDYYRGIIGAFRQQNGGLRSPEIIVYSANLAELVGILEAGNLADLAAWLLVRLEALRRAGAELAVIASNTPHVVFDEVARRSPLPLLSIVEETCRKAASLGLQRPGLMGTRFTMAADFYRPPFQAQGMSLCLPWPRSSSAFTKSSLPRSSWGSSRTPRGRSSWPSSNRWWRGTPRFPDPRLHRTAIDSRPGRIRPPLFEHHGDPCGGHRAGGYRLGIGQVVCLCCRNFLS